MINNSPSTISEPLLQNQLLQEALTQRQCENRQSCIRLTSNNQREKSDSSSSVQNNNQQRLSRQKQNAKRNHRTSSLSERQRHARNSSEADRRRRLQSSFSSTDSECDIACLSSNNAKMVPKNENVMASLPTITLQRAFEPEELLTDSYHTARHKQLPEDEILFLPKDQPITISHTSKVREPTNEQDALFRGGRQRSSYENISKYKINSSNKEPNECTRRTSVDHLPRKNYSHPVYDRKRPTVSNNERNVCYSKENDVLSQRNPWFGEEDSYKTKLTHYNNMGSSKTDNYYASCPSFKSLQSSTSNHHRRKLNRT